MVSEPADGLPARGIVRLSPIDDDAARAQEAVHAGVARLAIHIPVVVRVYLERLEGSHLALRHHFQVLVERPLPGGGMHASRIGDDPVEVEQPGPVLARGDLVLFLGCANLILLSSPHGARRSEWFSPPGTRGVSCAA